MLKTDLKPWKIYCVPQLKSACLLDNICNEQQLEGVIFILHKWMKRRKNYMDVLVERMYIWNHFLF